MQYMDAACGVAAVQSLLTLEGEGEAGAVLASSAVFLEDEGQAELVSSATASSTSI